MRDGDVVALEIVVNVNLPVAIDDVVARSANCKALELDPFACWGIAKYVEIGSAFKSKSPKMKVPNRQRGFQFEGLQFAERCDLRHRLQLEGLR